MLILTRRIGETLYVGDDVTVTVLGIKGVQVRIGIDAPRSRGRPGRGSPAQAEERAEAGEE